MKTPPQGYVKQTAHNELKRLLANAIAAKEQAERDRDSYMSLSANRANKAQAAETEVEELRAKWQYAEREAQTLNTMLWESMCREMRARMRGDA